MKVFLISYLASFAILNIGLLYLLFTTKPTFLNGRNRFERNWNEGGKILFYWSFFGAFILALSATKLFVWFAIIDKL